MIAAVAYGLYLLACVGLGWWIAGEAEYRRPLTAAEEADLAKLAAAEPTEAELAKRYRETYGSDSYTPEQIARLIAAAPVARWRNRRP